MFRSWAGVNPDPGEKRAALARAAGEWRESVKFCLDGFDSLITEGFPADLLKAEAEDRAGERCGEVGVDRLAIVLVLEPLAMDCTFTDGDAKLV